MKHLITLATACCALAALGIVGFSETAGASMRRLTATAPTTMIAGADAVVPAWQSAPAKGVRVVYPGGPSR